MKLRSIAAVAVVTILVLSTVGAGAAAPAVSPAEDSTETDADDVSQSNDVTQSDETSITSVTSDIDESSSVTIDDTVDMDVDVGSAGSSVADSMFGGFDVGSLLESLFDDLGISDGDGDDETDGDGDDETDSDGDDETDSDETDGDETDGTDDEDGTDESDGDDGDSSDETDSDDEDDSDETDGDGQTGDSDEESDETDDAESDELDRAAVERHVHEAVNEERTARGLEPLAFDTELRDIARAHSQDMAERGYFAHVDPEGNDVVDRYEAAGYDCSVNGYTGGENIAQTWYDTPVVTDDGDTVRYQTEQELADGIVTQWMNSPGHRENLLAPYWENEGIGVYVTDDDRVFATQNFC